MKNELKESNLFSLISTGKVAMPPSAVLLGLQVDQATHGEVSLSLSAASSFLNPAGHVQGGMLSAMLDEATGIAALTTLDSGEFVVTLEMKVQFISPGVQGGFQAQGRLIQRTGKIAFVDADLWQKDKLVARATSTLMIQVARR